MHGILDIIAALFVTMGPIKVLIVFAEKTADISHQVRRQIILQAVLVATTVGLVFIVFGQFLMKLFHFSVGSLTVAGGLILLIFGILMVLSEGDAGEKYTDEDAEDMAVYPFAVPLIATPMGIVVIMIFSANHSVTTTQFFGLVIALLVVMAINVGVLFSVERIMNHIHPKILQVAERVLGLMLSALAIETIVNGLQSLGVIST